MIYIIIYVKHIKLYKICTLQNTYIEMQVPNFRACGGPNEYVSKEDNCFCLQNITNVRACGEPDVPSSGWFPAPVMGTTRMLTPSRSHLTPSISTNFPALVLGTRSWERSHLDVSVVLGTLTLVLGFPALVLGMNTPRFLFVFLLAV